MRASLEERCRLFVENRECVKSAFAWESAYMYPLCASIFTAGNKTAEKEQLLSCKNLLKEKTGLFSNFRGIAKPVFICQLAMSENPSEKLSLMLDVYKQLKELFFGSQYLTTAAASITDLAQPAEYQNVVERTRRIYKQMKENHPFLTSGEDSSFAALLALSPKSDECIERECEECFQYLRPHFFSGNAIQSLSHVLALGDGTSDVKCEKALKLYDRLKESGLKYGTGNELATLGVLALLDVPMESLVSDMMEVNEFLCRQKGFGLFGIGSRQRVMYAGILTMCDYVPDLSVIETSALTGVISLIIAQQAAVMASAAAASAAASSSSGGN